MGIANYIVRKVREFQLRIVEQSALNLLRTLDALRSGNLPLSRIVIELNESGMNITGFSNPLECEEERGEIRILIEEAENAA